MSSFEQLEQLVGKLQKLVDDMKKRLDVKDQVSDPSLCIYLDGIRMNSFAPYITLSTNHFGPGHRSDSQAIEILSAPAYNKRLDGYTYFVKILDPDVKIEAGKVFRK